MGRVSSLSEAKGEPQSPGAQGGSGQEGFSPYPISPAASRVPCGPGSWGFPTLEQNVVLTVPCDSWRVFPQLGEGLRKAGGTLWWP